MSTLLDKLSAYKPFTAMVIGDFMLDQNVYGAAERLSPDAPVPVLHHSHNEDRPGGAANVALCLMALKGKVICFGVLGADSEGRALANAIANEGCDVTGLIEDKTRPTTIKRSLIGLAQHRHPQKMFRVDVESRDAIDSDICEAILTHVESKLDSVDIVCIEDYDKGVCTGELCARLIGLCRERGKPVLVDPAAIEDYGKYRGATAITPNRSEAELATGLDTPIDASRIHNAGLAARLGTDLDLDAVILTLDKHGALLEERGGSPQIVPTIARSVYDVSGAGDIVLAALAGARANGLSWRESVTFANAAAGLEVESFGVQPVPFANVQREILLQTKPLNGKERALDELLVEIDVQRAAGRTIVFTNGCFDVIHAGHVAYLREAKNLGDVLVVAVNSDQQVRAQKGENRPIYDIANRIEILSELQCVDYLTVFDDPTADNLLRTLHPDIYVKGGDYKPEEINEYDLVKQLGLDLRILAHRPGLGSTQVIKKINGEAD